MKAFLAGHDDHYDILYNVDCSVGKGGQNNLIADVKYIQWYYSVAATNPETAEDRRRIYRNVQVTGKCTGMDNDPLVQAIFAHQRALAHPTIDGRISVARTGVKVGDAAFFVLRIGARLARMFPNQWPRLDLVNGCPPEVATACKNCVPVLPVVA